MCIAPAKNVILGKGQHFLRSTTAQMVNVLVASDNFQQIK